MGSAHWSTGLGFASFATGIVLSTFRVVPLRSFIWPVVITVAPCIDPGNHRDLIAARRTGLDEGLPRHQAIFARVAFDREVNRVAVGVIDNGGLRQRNVSTWPCRPRPRSIRSIHAGKQFARRIVEDRAHLHIAAGLIDLRVDRLHQPLERLVRIGIDLGVDLLPDLDLIDRLLRQREVDIEPVERLQRHDRSAGAEILTDINAGGYPEPSV